MKSLITAAAKFEILLWPLVYVIGIWVTIVGLLWILPYLVIGMNEAWHFFYGV